MKKSIMVVFVLIFSTLGFSSLYGMGISAEGGLLINDVVVDITAPSGAVYYTDYKGDFNFMIGANATELLRFNSFSIDTGLRFSRKGWDYKAGGQTYGYTANYLELVPKFKWVEETSEMLNLQGYIGVGLAFKMFESYDLPSGASDPTDDVFKPFDCNIKFGLDTYIASSWLIGIGWERSVTNHYADANNTGQGSGWDYYFKWGDILRNNRRQI